MPTTGTKEPVLALVGTLMTIGEVNDIFPCLIIGKSFLAKNHKKSQFWKMSAFSKNLFLSLKIQRKMWIFVFRPIPITWHNDDSDCLFFKFFFFTVWGFSSVKQLCQQVFERKSQCFCYLNFENFAEKRDGIWWTQGIYAWSTSRLPRKFTERLPRRWM